MYSMTLPWKSFNLSLSDIETWMQTNSGEFYCGNSADTKLTLWFSEDPGSTIVTMCEQYWANLHDASDEANSYIPQAVIAAALAALKASLHTKEWTDMSAAERKLLTGQTPTRTELGL